MTQKIITAADILKMKGYQAPRFDTAAFNAAVTAFFQHADIGARLYIRPVRFIDEGEMPPCGFIDRSADVEERRRRMEDEVYLYGHVRTDELAGDLLFPEIIVDEAFCKNAIHMLQLMQGYVIRKSRGRYSITLL